MYPQVDTIFETNFKFKSHTKTATKATVFHLENIAKMLKTLVNHLFFDCYF